MAWPWLRAMGFQTGLVRWAFLSVTGVIAMQGTAIVVVPLLASLAATAWPASRAAAIRPAVALRVAD